MKKLLAAVFIFLSLSTSALAAPTLSNVKRENAGSQVLYTGNVTFDSSYPTGGETINPAKLPLSTINSLNVTGGGYVYAFDPTTSKLKVYSGTNPGGTVSSTFTGTDQVTNPQFFTVYASAAPAGVDVYVKVGNSPETYLAANHAGSKVILDIGTDALFIDADATPATDGFPIFVDEAGLRLVADFSGIPGGGPSKLFVTCYGGLMVEINNASTAGLDPLTYNTATGHFEYLDTVPLVNLLMRTSATWIGNSKITPAGTIVSTFTGGGASALTEVSNGTDLSALTAQFTILGN